MAAVPTPDLRALMDVATREPLPNLPTPWPSSEESIADWEASVAEVRARHEAWAERTAATLAGAGASGGGAPGAESPLAGGAPAADVLAVGGVREVVAGGVRARVYTPLGDGPFPAVVMLHGGGWWIGGGPAGLAAADGPCRLTCLQLGAVVVNVDYRQAPEHPFPVPLEDCYAATCWTVENADALGIEASRVAVMGPSAGANLAAGVALLARDRGGPSIRFLMLMVPALDATLSSASITENGTGYDLTRDYLVSAWQMYLGQDVPRAHPLASPLHQRDLSGLPTTHVVVADFDPLRDDGVRFVERLTADGVPVTLSRYPMGHSVMTPAVAVDYATDVFSRLARALSG